MDDCNWLEAIMNHTFCVYFDVIAKIYVYRLCDKPLTSNKTNKFKIEYHDGYVIQNIHVAEKNHLLYRYRRTD